MSMPGAGGWGGAVVCGNQGSGVFIGRHFSCCLCFSVKSNTAVNLFIPEAFSFF